MIIKYPKNLNEKDTVGIISTSGGIYDQNDQKRLDNAKKNLTNIYKFNFKESSNLRQNHKLTSMDGKIRAKEFMTFWQNENISWVAQAKGGEFLIDMLPFIDSDIIKNNNPKWVNGYSDCTLLNFYLTTNFNIATITSNNFLSFGMNDIHSSLLNTIKIMKNFDEDKQTNFSLYEKEKLPRKERKFDNSYNLTEKIEYKNLYENKKDIISGRLIGGCIDVLIQLCGTPFDNTVNFCNQFEEGMLWYLENAELSPPSLYRTLLQMKKCNWFNNTNGFIIGRTYSNTPYLDFEYTDALHKVFDDLNVPVIYDIDTGHVAPQWTLVNGSYAKFNYEKGKASIIQYKK